VDVFTIANPIPTIVLQSLSNYRVCDDERINGLPIAFKNPLFLSY
jgi:hypothetical protein